MEGGGEEEEEEEEVSQMLSDDYARAEFIRDRLVPKAVLFFTGEIMDEEDEVSHVLSTMLLYGPSPLTE